MRARAHVRTRNGGANAKKNKGLRTEKMKFVSIGYGNVIAADRVVLVASPDSAPVKRLVQDAKEQGRLIDVSSGRRTRSVIVTDSEHVILSALQVETLAPRFGAEDLKERDGETEAAAQPEAERPPRASRRETAPPKKKEKE